MPDARTHHTATGPQTATAAVLGWFDAHDAVENPGPRPHLRTGAEIDAADELLYRARDALLPAIAAAPADTLADLSQSWIWRIVDEYDCHRWPSDPVFLSILGVLKHHAHPALVEGLRASARYKPTSMGRKIVLGGAPRAVVKALAE